MKQILAFDSMYIVNPIGRVYVNCVNRIVNNRNTSARMVVLYRLDKDNVFISKDNNLTGVSIGAHKDEIESLSIKFYRFLEDSKVCDVLN